MGQKARQAMAEARANLDARYREHGSLKGTRPCQGFSSLRMARCGTPSQKTVDWPGQPPVPACSLRCATLIAGEEHFHDARWG